MKILLIIFVLHFVKASEKWFDSLNGIDIHNYEHFKTELASAENENSHIMIEFYMEQCRFCIQFKDTWNIVHDELSKKHNGENALSDPSQKKVAFFKIDGEKIHELRRRYRVNGFPSFVYLKAGTKGKEAKIFEGERTKEGMIKWVDDLITKFEEEKSEEPKANEKSKSEKKKHTPKSDPKDQSDLDKNIFKLSSSISGSFSKIQERLDKIEKKDRDADEYVSQLVLSHLSVVKLQYLLVGILLGLVSSIIMIAQNSKGLNNEAKQNNRKSVLQ